MVRLPWGGLSSLRFSRRRYSARRTSPSGTLCDGRVLTSSSSGPGPWGGITAQLLKNGTWQLTGVPPTLNYVSAGDFQEGDLQARPMSSHL